jgi:uncharacterized membrane protein
MKRRRFIFRNVIAPIVAAVACIPTLAIAIWKVTHGRGAAMYTNVYGLAMPYTSVLILVVVLIVVLSTAFIAREIYFWRNRHDGPSNSQKIDSRRSSVKLVGRK